MKAFRICGLLTLGFALPAAAVAPISKPVAVSPGHARGIAEVADPCPTFHWAADPSAESVRLAVYELEGPAGDVDDGVERGSRTARVVIRQVFPGLARGWTPTLEGCLEPGRLYAWTIRTERGDSASRWSDPRLFRVRDVPTAGEVADALVLLRAYMAANGSSPPGPAERTPSDAPATSRRSIAGVDAAVSPGAAPGPVAMGTGMPVTSFSVDDSGGVLAATLAGDGSAITGVDADTLQGRAPMFFADGTHSHTLDTILVGTSPVLTSPPVSTQCEGSSAATSSCVADCPASTVLISGGCGNAIPTGSPLCTLGKRVVTRSLPEVDGWKCEVTCADSSGNVKALGQVLCGVEEGQIG